MERHAAAEERVKVEICEVSEVAALRLLEPPRDPASSWLVWMVHRVWLNDPLLKSVDFSFIRLPQPEAEHRVVPKLFKALAHNRCVQRLALEQCDLRGGDEAKVLADSLVQNCALRVLNISGNSFESHDLQAVISSLGENCALRELYCARQKAGEPADRHTLQAAVDVLQENHTLQKLGMDLTETHCRDQITRALVRNVDQQRRRRLAVRSA